jgi:hypothetical protein
MARVFEMIILVGCISVAGGLILAAVSKCYKNSQKENSDKK